MSEMGTNAYHFSSILFGRKIWLNCTLTARGDKIVSCTEDEDRDAKDFSDRIAVPAFIDIHTHGFRGIDTSFLSTSKLEEWAELLMTTGVAGFIPTIVSSSQKDTGDFMRTVRELSLKEKHVDGRADVLGARLEGPFINSEKKGAHNPSHLLPSSIANFEELVEDIPNWDRILRVVDIAPELPGAISLILFLTNRNVIVSLGHSDSTFNQAETGVDAGARLCTHLFNGMRRIHHRDPGIAVAMLLDERVYTEIINDPFHLSPETVRLAFQTKKRGKIVAITDSISSTQMPDGDYTLGDLKINVEGGRCLIAGTDTIAGSTLTMDQAFRNFVHQGFSIEDSTRFCSTNPSKIIGLQGRGVLGEGKVADITILDKQYKVTGMIRRGRLHEF